MMITIRRLMVLHSDSAYTPPRKAGFLQIGGLATKEDEAGKKKSVGGGAVADSAILGMTAVRERSVHLIASRY